MNDTMIRVEGLSKHYTIGTARQSHPSLRELLRHRLGRGFSRNGRDDRKGSFWALKDLSFEIRRGEVVGIIGHNGAGKSTLLKILSRITEPTSGRAEIHGRVGSLLEVGTGFHPELTGRENVFLNGAILGMRKAEIERKFDEIIAFAEIERFIDTPVKRYSSGMYVRLAFSVAAHLQSEIMIMDEVLAVGDPGFQYKCLDKIQSVRREGRTILFVSHSMATVTRLCERVLLLERGQLKRDGSAAEVAGAFLSAQNKRSPSEKEWTDPEAAPSHEAVRLRRLRVVDEEGETIETVDIRRPMGVEMTFEVLEGGHVMVPNVHFVNESGLTIFAVLDLDPEWRRRERPPGVYVSTARIPGNFLSEGTFTLTVAISRHIPTTGVFIVEENAITFQVIDSVEGDAARGDYHGDFPGVVRPLVDWTTRFTPQGELVQTPW
jgi:lipopolysaccharide transport system ATP-binding protein